MVYQGVILKGIGGFYYVEAADKVLECRARGLFRKQGLTPLPGDKVTVRAQGDDTNVIEEIHERKNSFLRPPVANIDLLIIVVSTDEPKPNYYVIDKMTALASFKGIEAVIAITKTDLSSPQEIKSVYSKAGYKTFCINNVDGGGASELQKLLSNKVSVFTGNTGVGKSSLLNNISPELRLETAQISEKLGRGRHTTRQVEFFSVAGGYVADTPGFAAIDIRDSDLDCNNLQFQFAEFEPYLSNCRFTGCAHLKDKGCAITPAVEKGEIGRTRYESYMLMYEELQEEMW